MSLITTDLLSLITTAIAAAQAKALLDLLPPTPILTLGNCLAWTFQKFPRPHPAHENYTLMGFEFVTTRNARCVRQGFYEADAQWAMPQHTHEW